MNTFITGIYDFVGSNLIVVLKQCHNFYGLDIAVLEKEGVIKFLLEGDLHVESSEV